MGLAAEERGLLGSQYYTENPILPLENTVACINIDMIGRIDDLHLNGDHNYIHVIGVNKLSTDLKPIVEAANKDILINLDYSYDRPNEPMRLYYRSDHYNFAKNGIPALFFFSGLHPHYHTPEDTVDKIDFPMMVKREHLIFKTVWDIADRDERLKVDIPE
jgi:Zn-dependent M28 family amino/carboxypeptidase